MTGENCIFCKIGRDEIPCSKVYEDDKFFAFLDIKPVSKGHTLLIPKEHIVWMQESDDETISEIFKVAKKIMTAMKKGLSCELVQVSVVGKDVPHFHIHLFPRFENDEIRTHHQMVNYENGEKQEIANKISSTF